MQHVSIHRIFLVGMCLFFATVVSTSSAFSSPIAKLHQIRQKSSGFTKRQGQWRHFQSRPIRAHNDADEGDQQHPFDNLTNAADVLLKSSVSPSSSSESRFGGEAEGEGHDGISNPFSKSDEASTRRLFFASTLIAAGTALGASSASAASPAGATETQTKLQWEVTPVNKRTGVKTFDAEQVGYNVRFVTYLSRFLLCFDQDCQRWWYNRASDLPRTATADQVNALRLQQFGAFSASVEVGLQGYRVANGGPAMLLRSLLRRYCPDTEQLKATREAAGLPPLSESNEQKQDREVKEARRQIALLFGLMETNQPVEQISKLLAAIDNGSIASVQVIDPGSGYAPGYGPPEVRFAPPEAGDEYETATGRAILTTSGEILRIDLVNRGFGYSKAPIVTISPPAALRFANDTLRFENDVAGEKAEQAQAKAFVFRSGVNKGRLERIQLDVTGQGYTPREIIRIRFSAPEMSAADGGATATATAVLEYEVSDILIVKNGTGYAVEKPIAVFVEPPPLTARVNMNDPMMTRIIGRDQPLPATTIPTKEMLKKMPRPNDPLSVASRAATEANKAGAGGCVGRGCYDRPVVAAAYPVATAGKNSYTTYRNADETSKAQTIEDALDIRSAVTAKRNFVSGASSGSVSGVPELRSFGAKGSSTSLLSLLPAGIGLAFKNDLNRYQLAVDPTYTVDDAAQFLKGSGSSNRPLDPDFGPRGRSPIERDMQLGISSYLRFAASGAICCSGVHLALTPIDVVKTKVQTDPVKYPGVGRTFQKVLEEGGSGAFFTGWAPTFLGFFVWGGLSYALTEFLRRSFQELAGLDAASLEVPIILAASGIASFFGSFIICPFEAIRIRSVAQPDFGKNIVQVFNRIVKEEGLFSLFSAVPVFLTKEVPFAMAKFTVFDISTAYLYEQFPAAREDIQLSLLISLAGGTLGGFTAAVVSNPADATITQMKKGKSDLGPVETAKSIIDRGGPQALFTGLPLRMIFFALVVSLQFLVYDAVRFALGIGTDDLKLYLDVLGGALSESGGPL
jgi:solute carrier family 25 phosphate transporter 3